MEGGEAFVQEEDSGVAEEQEIDEEGGVIGLGFAEEGHDSDKESVSGEFVEGADSEELDELDRMEAEMER